MSNEYYSNYSLVIIQGLTYVIFIDGEVPPKIIFMEPKMTNETQRTLISALASVPFAAIVLSLTAATFGYVV